jgi:hypothetical protein
VISVLLGFPYLYSIFSVLLSVLFLGIRFFISMILLKIRKTSEKVFYSMFYSIYKESIYFVSADCVFSLTLSLENIYHLKFADWGTSYFLRWATTLLLSPAQRIWMANKSSHALWHTKTPSSVNFITCASFQGCTLVSGWRSHSYLLKQSSSHLYSALRYATDIWSL